MWCGEFNVSGVIFIKVTLMDSLGEIRQCFQHSCHDVLAFVSPNFLTE